MSESTLPVIATFIGICGPNPENKYIPVNAPSEICILSDDSFSNLF